MSGLVVVKLGGSLITDKSGVAVLRREVLARLAGEIAAAEEAWSEGGLLVTHGSGSFGHAAAARHGIGAGGEQAARAVGVSATQAAAHALHRHVLDTLREAGLACFSWAASSALVSDDATPVAIEAEPVLRALDLGLVPVGFGDVVVDRARGASIASTEAVLRALLPEIARHRTVDRVLWLGETEGVWDRDGALVETLDRDNAEAVLAAAGASAATDVTGGMRLRVETVLALAEQGIGSWIGDGTVAGRLEKALRGETVVGTRVEGA